MAHIYVGHRDGVTFLNSASAWFSSLSNLFSTTADASQVNNRFFSKNIVQNRLFFPQKHRDISTID